MSEKWFEVDKKGLGQLLTRKGKSFIVLELIQNALDQRIKKVDVALMPIPNRSACSLVVIDDDPDGFADLTHAYTLFAPSSKKANPEQRGRFNLGEKLVMSCCEEAKVISTTGGVIFPKGGDRRRTQERTKEGSEIQAVVPMTRAEYEEVCQEVVTIIPPENIKVFFNGVEIEHRCSVAQIEVTLPTEISDEEGNLKRTARKTLIHIYQPKDDEKASIYEMGLKVVETGDKYHVDIAQKVPLNMDRDNVPPSYLRTLRTHVLNATYNLLKPDDSTTAWVRDASGDENAEPEAIKTVMTMRFGEKSVAYDPSDSEANRIATAEGYTVVPGRSMSVGEWSNVRRIGMVLPAGRVTPSPKPFSPDGKPLKLIPESEWTVSMQNLVGLMKQWAETVHVPLHTVRITNDVNWGFGGCYGQGVLYINRGRMGKAFFDEYPRNAQKVLEFFIHEISHHYGSHLSEEYYDGLCKVGAGLIVAGIMVKELA